MKIFRLIFAAKFFQYFIKYELFSNPLKDLEHQLKEENKKSTESFRLLNRHLTMSNNLEKMTSEEMYIVANILDKYLTSDEMSIILENFNMIFPLTTDEATYSNEGIIFVELSTMVPISKVFKTPMNLHLSKNILCGYKKQIVM